MKLNPRLVAFRAASLATTIEHKLIAELQGVPQACSSWV